MSSQWKYLCDLEAGISQTSTLRDVVDDLAVSNTSKLFSQPEGEKAAEVITGLTKKCSQPENVFATTTPLSSASRNAFVLLNILSIGSVHIRDVILDSVKRDPKLAQDMITLFSSKFNAFIRVEDSIPGSICDMFLKDSALLEKTTRQLVCEQLDSNVESAREHLLSLPADWYKRQSDAKLDVIAGAVRHLTQVPCPKELSMKRACLASYYSFACRSLCGSRPAECLESLSDVTSNRAPMKNTGIDPVKHPAQFVSNLFLAALGKSKGLAASRESEGPITTKAE